MVHRYLNSLHGCPGLTPDGRSVGSMVTYPLAVKPRCAPPSTQGQQNMNKLNIEVTLDELRLATLGLILRGGYLTGTYGKDSELVHKNEAILRKLEDIYNPAYLESIK